MRINIPMTGTIIDFDPELFKLDGIGISGDPADPVRPVPVNLGDVSWTLVSIDLDNDKMEIELSADYISAPVFDGKGSPILDEGGSQIKLRRQATTEEQQALLDNAKKLIESKTVDELYQATGVQRLVKPSNVILKYGQYKELISQELKLS